MSAQFQGLFHTIFHGRVTIDPASLVDAAGATVTATVPGAAVGDVVLFAPGVDLQGITVTAYVSAANTVAFRVQNESTATVDLASSSWAVTVLRPIANG